MIEHKLFSSRFSLPRYLESIPIDPSHYISIARAIAIAATIGAIVNVWLYSSYAATPIIQADAWYFLESFVSRHYSHSLTAWDLFVQRGSTDHAQPIQKLILLFHTRYFDMDFRVEGLIGVGFATALCFFVMFQMRETTTSPIGRIAGALLVGIVPALWLSLNANNIYTWSLVTIGFSAQLFTCVFLCVFFWTAVNGYRLWLFPAALALGMVVDELAIITIFVALLAALIVGIAQLRHVFVAALVSMAGIMLARIGLFIAAEASGTSSTAMQVDGLPWSTFLSPESWKGVVVPLYTSLIYTEHLQKWAPGHLNLAAAVVAAFGGFLHIYFWLSVYRMRRTGDTSLQAALAVGLMLLSYALTAGIIVTRVPEFGWSYVYQPRYIIFYQIATVAIVVLMHRRVTNPISSWVSHRTEAIFAVAIVLILALFQLAVTRSSWQLVPYLTSYWQNASFSLGSSAVNPDIRPEQCPASYDFCNYDPAKRAKLIGLLKQHNLNIFSPGFQARNRLYPDSTSIPGFTSDKK